MHSTLRQNGHPSNSYISIILDGRLNCATCDVSVTYSKYIPLCEVLQNVILTAQEIVEAKTSLAFGLWASEIHEIEQRINALSVQLPLQGTDALHYFAGKTVYWLFVCINYIIVLY